MKSPEQKLQFIKEKADEGSKMNMELDQHKRCTTCNYEKSATRAACVDCHIEIDGVEVNPTNWEAKPSA